MRGEHFIGEPGGESAIEVDTPAGVACFFGSSRIMAIVPIDGGARSLVTMMGVRQPIEVHCSPAHLLAAIARTLRHDLELRRDALKAELADKTHAMDAPPYIAARAAVMQRAPYDDRAMIDRELSHIEAELRRLS
jgi:hypothetical protein